MKQFVRGRLWLAITPLLITLGACDKIKPGTVELTLPTEEEAAEFYEKYQAVKRVELSGNVVVLHAGQTAQQLEFGGAPWARVGPYIYLLSPVTRDLFVKYPGVAAVRVITQVGEEEEVARAMMVRDTMGDYQWQRSAELLTSALSDGAKSPRRIDDLIRWGEQYADYDYNPAYLKKK